MDVSALCSAFASNPGISQNHWALQRCAAFQACLVWPNRTQQKFPPQKIPQQKSLPRNAVPRLRKKKTAQWIRAGQVRHIFSQFRRKVQPNHSTTTVLADNLYCCCSWSTV